MKDVKDEWKTLDNAIKRSIARRDVNFTKNISKVKQQKMKHLKSFSYSNITEMKLLNSSDRVNVITISNILRKT